MNLHILSTRQVSPLATWRSRLCLMTMLAASGLCIQTNAQQTDTWNGGGADNFWNDAANWNQAVTTNGDNLIFTGTTRLAANNNFVGLDINSITLNGQGFALSGNALTITNGYTDNAGSNSCSIALNLGASQTFANNAAGTTNTITTGFSMGVNSLTISGNGDLFINGGISGLTNDAITVNSGATFRLGATETFGSNTVDALIINSGTMQAGAAGAVPNGPGVGNILDNSTLDVNANTLTMNGLEGNGIVDNLNAAAGTLTLGSANSNAVFSGTIKNTGGAISLTKNGYGTETLSGNNVYSGVTTINGGTLAVALGGSLGEQSKSMVIAPGAILDVSQLNPIGYLPQFTFNLNAGTPSKPYTNFLGSYDTNYPTFIITTNITATSTNMSTNSIVSVINYDVNGDFNLGGGSFAPVAPAPGYATFTVNGNLNLDNSLGSVNNLFFLLNNITNAGGGLNDLIVVTNGTLNIGDVVNIVVSPAAGSLATGKYTLIESPNYVAGGDFNGSQPPTYNVIAPRGVSGVVDTTSQPGNILLAASGTAAPGTIVWAGTTTQNIWDIHVTQDWKNGGSPDFFFSQDNVTFDDTGVGSINMQSPLTPGSVTFNNNVTNYTFAPSGGALMAGPMSLTLNGKGSVNLQNPNSYTGNTIINAGTLEVSTYGPFNVRPIYSGVTPGQVVFGGPASLEIGDNIANGSVTLDLGGFVLNSGANAQITSSQQQGVGRGANDLFQATVGANIVRNVGSSLYINVGASLLQRANNGIYFTNTIPWTNGLLLGGYAHVGSDWVQAATNLGAASPGQYNYTGYSNNAALAVWLPTNNMSVSNSTFADTASATINTLKLTGPSTVTVTAGQTLSIQSGGLLVSTLGVGPSVVTGGTLKGAAGQDLIVLQNLTSAPFTIGSVIADNGTATALTLGGLGGTVILTNNNTYTGTTYINAGTLQIGAGTAIGNVSATSTIIDNSTLAFNRPDVFSFGVFGGTGGLTQLGTGTLVLTANNNIKGPVVISAGTLQLGNGGAAGSLSNTASMLDNGTLAFDNNITVSYPKTITGLGNVVQTGSGTLTINTNETYSGFTTVSNGTLALSASGTISNTTAITVNAGAIFDATAVGGITLRSLPPAETLGGGGTVNGQVTTAAGTSLFPGGNSGIGTLTVNGNLSLNGGSYVFDISNGGNDKINVNGTLNQNGGVVLVEVTGSPLANGLYNLITASGGLAGSVANVAVANFIQPGQIAILTNASPNTVDLLVVPGTFPSLIWAGDGTQNLWDTTAASKWLSNGISVLYNNGAFVTFNDSGSASPAVNLDAIVYPSTVTVNDTNNNYTFGIPGGSGVNKLSGGTSLTKNGPGKLTLQTVDDYISGTTINGGTIQLNGDGGVNDDGMVGTGPVTNNGVLIANNANTETLNGSINGSGLLVQEGAGTLILAGNNFGNTGPVSIPNANSVLQVGNGFAGSLSSGNVTNNGNLLLNPGAPISIPGNISGGGSITNVSGVTTLSGNNSYTGLTVLQSGTLRAGSSTAIPAASTVVLNDGSNSVAGILDLNDQNVSVGNLIGTNFGSGTAGYAPSQIANNGVATGTLILGGNITNTFYGQIVDNNNSGTGKAALAVLNGANITLNPAVNAASVVSPNTFSGGVLVSNAQLFTGINIGGSTPAGEAQGSAGNSVYTLAGTNTTLGLCGSGGNTTATLSTSLAGVIVPGGANVRILGPQRGTFTCVLTGSGNLTFEPQFVRTRWAGNLSAFTGTVTLLAESTAGGNLGIDGTAGLPNATVIFQTNSPSQLQVVGTTTANVFPIGALSGGDNTSLLGGGTSAGGNGTASTIWAIGGLGTSTIFGGQIADGGCGIRKVGAGTLTLTNNVLSYGSQTVVSNGVLTFAPLVANLTALADGAGYLVGSNFTLAASGILDMSGVGGTLYLGHVSSQSLFGNGTLNGNLDVTNGFVQPGRRASTTTYFTGSGLTINGSYTMRTACTNILSLNRTNTPANDSITASSIAYNGVLIVTNLGDTAFPNASTNKFQLFNGPLSGSFASVVLPSLPTNEFWINNLTVNGSISVVNTNAALANNPTNITVLVSGGTLSLTWPTDHLGWTLQAQTNTLGVGLKTNGWVDVPGSSAQTSATITMDPTQPTVFYRLSQQP